MKSPLDPAFVLHRDPGETKGWPGCVGWRSESAATLGLSASAGGIEKGVFIVKLRAIHGLGAFGLALVIAVPGVAGAQNVQVKPELPGPIDSMKDAQDTAKMLFLLADANGDGLISQKEATDVGNLLVGGFFFRADTNGDGTISQEEANAARSEFLNQRPMLRYIFETAQQQARENPNVDTNQNPLRNVANLFDANNDKQLQATEVRQGVQAAVQALYATADSNRDGQMSPAEINAAVAGLAQQVAQSAFQAADSDNDGAISQQEFEKAIIEPSRFVFKVLDGDNDGRITREEAQTAERFVRDQLRSLEVPEFNNPPIRGLGSPTAPASGTAPGTRAPGAAPVAPGAAPTAPGAAPTAPATPR